MAKFVWQAVVSGFHLIHTACQHKTLQWSQCWCNGLQQHTDGDFNTLISFCKQSLPSWMGKICTMFPTTSQSLWMNTFSSLVFCLWKILKTDYIDSLVMHSPWCIHLSKWCKFVDTLKILWTRDKRTATIMTTPPSRNCMNRIMSSHHSKLLSRGITRNYVMGRNIDRTV